MTTIRKLLLFSCSLVFSVGLGAGCSSPAPEPTLYLLRGEASVGIGEIDAEVRAGLSLVILAPYLTSSRGIVLETAPGQVRPARQHQWAEPLDAGMRWFLRTEIGRILGSEIHGGLVDVSTWDYTIDVYVSRFHGTAQGTALLQAGFSVKSKLDGSFSEYRFTKSMPLPDSGYPALVAAQQQLLRDLAEEIATALRAKMDSASAP